MEQARNRFLRQKDINLVLGTIIGSIIYSFSVVFVVDLGSFYTSGVTGISQIITSLLGRLLDRDLIGVTSILIAVINIPLFLIAWRGVSKRFAIISLVSVGLQVVLVALFEFLFSKGFNPFKAFTPVEGENNVGRMLALAITGGLLTGVGEGACLKFGGSTGGMDVVSQYVSLTRHKSFAAVSLSVDLVIISLSMIIGSVEIGVYTIIRMIISIIVLDKIYTAYHYSKVVIVTEERQRMKDALITRFNHGVTIYQAVGAYTNKPKYVMESIVWAFEAVEYIKVAKSVDPACFVSTVGVKRVAGHFNVNVIA